MRIAEMKQKEVSYQKIEYRGYTARVSYNVKKGVYIARTKGVMGLWLYCDGISPEDLEKNYCDTIDQYIRYTEEERIRNRAALNHSTEA